MMYDDEDEQNYDNLTYLSELMQNIKSKIDKVYGDHTYIDIFSENKKIVIVLEEKFLTQIKDLISNYYIAGLEYQAGGIYAPFLRYEQTSELVNFCIVSG